MNVKNATNPGVFVLGCLLAVAGCDESEAYDQIESDGGETDGQLDRGGLGKADVVGSCQTRDGNTCGGQSDGTCWCDEQCSRYGDCCSDYGAVCLGESPSDPPVDTPLTPEEIFDDASLCSDGTPFTRSDALSLFAPGATVSPLLQDFRVVGATRTCNDVTGCSPWTVQDGSPTLYYNFQDVTWTPSGGHYFPASDAVSFPPMPRARFKVIGNDIQLLVTMGAGEHPSVGFGCNLSTLDGDSIECLSGSSYVLEGNDNLGSGRLTWYSGEDFFRRLEGSGAINDECFRLRVYDGSRAFVIYGEW